MAIHKIDSHEGQVMYLGRWVPKKYFRAFVYNAKGESKLAESYEQYESLTSNGVWVSSKPDVSTKQGKPKDAVRAND